MTGTTITNPLGHATTSVLSPQRGQTTTTTDPNGKITDLVYDPLGRLTSVWLPGRAKATQTANLKYAYTISQTAPNAVATSELRNNGTYTLTYELMDGLLRPRLTQAPAEGTAGGRVLTETVYDSRGLTTDTKGPYYATGAPDATMYAITDAQIPSATRVTYDGAGRPVTSALLANGTEKWHTTTTYGGDRTSTTPPTGGTPTTTLVDARGHTTQLWQYHGAAATGSAARRRRHQLRLHPGGAVGPRHRPGRQPVDLHLRPAWSPHRHPRPGQG